jgi:hypothetical protein
VFTVGGTRDRNTGGKTGVGLVIEFDSGIVQIYPSHEQLEGPEIALLAGFEDGARMCWRHGEETFEDLA